MEISLSKIQSLTRDFIDQYSYAVQGKGTIQFSFPVILPDTQTRQDGLYEASEPELSYLASLAIRSMDGLEQALVKKENVQNQLLITYQTVPKSGPVDFFGGIAEALFCSPDGAFSVPELIHVADSLSRWGTRWNRKPGKAVEEWEQTRRLSAAKIFYWTAMWTDFSALTPELRRQDELLLIREFMGAIPEDPPKAHENARFVVLCSNPEQADVWMSSPMSYQEARKYRDHLVQRFTEEFPESSLSGGTNPVSAYQHPDDPVPVRVWKLVKVPESF